MIYNNVIYTTLISCYTHYHLNMTETEQQLVDRKMSEYMVGADFYRCDDCNEIVDPDQEQCLCGWSNPIYQFM